MYLDSFLLFDNDVALTATRVSTHSVDLAAAVNNIGVGENMYVFLYVGTTLASSGGTATLQLAFETDADVALGSPTILQDLPALIAEATLVAGFILFKRISPNAPGIGDERYLGATYTVGTENFTSGKITCGLVHDIQAWQSYAKNFTSA